MKGIPALLTTTIVCGLAGCANVPPHDEISDPLEPVNRVVDKFNDRVDRAIIKPVAEVYDKATPAPVRTSVTNFFGNLGEPGVIVN